MGVASVFFFPGYVFVRDHLFLIRILVHNPPAASVTMPLLCRGGVVSSQVRMSCGQLVSRVGYATVPLTASSLDSLPTMLAHNGVVHGGVGQRTTFYCVLASATVSPKFVCFFPCKEVILW